MSAATPAGRPLLVVGGCGGLVGRAVLEEFAPDRRIVSVHRHRAANEAAANVEWVPADAVSIADWTPLLRGVDEVLLLAWHRAGGRRRFVPLARSLVRLVHDAEKAGLRRLVHVSVPAAPERLERSLPYLYAKRAVDRALEESALEHSIVRPTMLFGPRDKLLTVMLGTMHRYRRFPMFGDGNYHISPIAARDLALVLRRELGQSGRRTVEVGGPRRWRYRELTDRLFAFLGLEPRYFSLGPRMSVAFARLVESVGSTKLYAYEVEWLLSDMLGLPPYPELGRPFRSLETFVEAEVARLHGY